MVQTGARGRGGEQGHGVFHFNSGPQPRLVLCDDHDIISPRNVSQLWESLQVAVHPRPISAQVQICYTPTGERLGGTSDPQARPAQEESGAIVTPGDYRTGEKAAGTSSLFSCRIGRTPAWGGHAPPLLRASSRTRARSLRSL